MSGDDSKRIKNFNAGPAGLPVEVLQRAQSEMLNYGGSGLGVMEMSHRSKEFIAIHKNTESLVRELLNVPTNYKVLFMQGGATGQFAAIPMNLLGGGVGEYLVTGVWSASAAKEAAKYGEISIVASSAESAYTTVPDPSTWKRAGPRSSYFFYCANETVHGVEFPFVPEITDVPLVADYSSSFMSAPIDISKHGVIIAGAQKNVGPAGVTIVIVRDDLLGRAAPTCPVVLNYKETAEKDSMYNTPPCYSIYMVGLVLEWIKKQGGVEEMARRSKAKSELLYDFIDKSGFYQ